jgi:type I restriction enzyme M protein
VGSRAGARGARLGRARAARLSASARAPRQYPSRAKQEKDKAAAVVTRLEKAREKLAAKLAERGERIAEARRRAEDDRKDVAAVGDELVALYGDPDELLKHARVVGFDEIEENEFNLSIPRYVDTFEPEPGWR